MESSKSAMRAHWEQSACGEVYAEGNLLEEHLRSQAGRRYALEASIHEFAEFPSGRGLEILEVGVGMGADHLEWAKHDPARLVGIDITGRAVDWTRRRLTFFGFTPRVFIADAEALPFADASFDLAYSWGVLHHSTSTAAGVLELHRVLKPGGTARVMIYHARSIVGSMLWLRYALLAGRPGRSLSDVYARHLESPGTQAFTVAQAREMFEPFSTTTIRTELSIGDLLEGEAGRQHEGWALQLARQMWPRALLRKTASRYGLFMLIAATKHA